MEPGVDGERSLDNYMNTRALAIGRPATGLQYGSDSIGATDFARMINSYWKRQTDEKEDITSPTSVSRHANPATTDRVDKHRYWWLVVAAFLLGLTDTEADELFTAKFDKTIDDLIEKHQDDDLEMLVLNYWRENQPLPKAPRADNDDPTEELDGDADDGPSVDASDEPGRRPTADTTSDTRLGRFADWASIIGLGVMLVLAVTGVAAGQWQNPLTIATAMLGAGGMVAVWWSRKRRQPVSSDPKLGTPGNRQIQASEGSGKVGRDHYSASHGSKINIFTGIPVAVVSVIALIVMAVALIVVVVIIDPSSSGAGGADVDLDEDLAAIRSENLEKVRQQVIVRRLADIDDGAWSEPTLELEFGGFDLEGQDLSGLGDLSGADFEDAVLTGADLTGADLTGAKLVGTDFTDADLPGATLLNANTHLGRSDDVVEPLSRTIFVDADLTGADLTEANLRGADFTGATLDAANLSDVDLRKIKFDANTSFRGVCWAHDSELKIDNSQLSEILQAQRVPLSIEQGSCVGEGVTG